MSLNEKLAEVCGIPMDGSTINGNLCKVLKDESGVIRYIIWSPTTDLNQLRECYLASEKSFVIEHPEVDFDTAFSFALRNLLYDNGHSVIDLATAWVKHPELVAQAIHKAKGVE